MTSIIADWFLLNRSLKFDTSDFDPLNKTVQGILGMQANPILTQEESVKIADIKNFMKTDIERIVENGDNGNIHPAECRTSR